MKQVSFTTDFQYELLSSYLSMVRNDLFKMFSSDEKLSKLYLKLINYVHSKIELPEDFVYTNSALLTVGYIEK